MITESTIFIIFLFFFKPDYSHNIKNNILLNFKANALISGKILNYKKVVTNNDEMSVMTKRKIFIQLIILCAYSFTNIVQSCYVFPKGKTS